MSDEPWPKDQPDYQSLAEFRYEIQRFLRFSEGAARAAGLEPRQHQALLAIRGFAADQDPSVGAIAERLQIQHHSAVELIRRLDERGLIRRTRDTDDRRVVLVSVTSQGQQILDTLTTVHRAELRSIGPRLIRALSVIVDESTDQSDLLDPDPP